MVTKTFWYPSLFKISCAFLLKKFREISKQMDFIHFFTEKSRLVSSSSILLM